MQKQHKTVPFIGRTREIDLFKHWLTESHGPHVLYFFDAAEEAEKKGGVGKTSLLKKCAEIAKQQQDTGLVMIDFFNIADRDRITVARRITTGLQALYPGWSPTSFTTALEQLAHEEEQAATTSETTDIAYIRSREALTAALVADLKALAECCEQEQKQLLVFFDTFELIEQNPSIAVLRLAQTFPDTYQTDYIRFVIAGRNKLDWTQSNWQGREQDVLPFALEPFNQEEMVHYVEAESFYTVPVGSEQAAALYTRTEGRPILIGLASDVLDRRILTLTELVATPQQEFERYLVTRINELANPLNWVILFMAHAYHRFTLPLLRYILDEETLLKLLTGNIQSEALFETLGELSFIRQPGGGDELVLHDEMRRLVTKYCWDIQDPDRRYRKAISQRVIVYNEQAISYASSEGEKQAYTIETLYHRLYLDLNEGLHYFQDQFDYALSHWQVSFARLLLQETRAFFQAMSPIQQCDFRLAKARLFSAEDNASASLSSYEALERDGEASWLAEHTIELLMLHGRCYQLLNRFSEAIDYYNRALALTKDKGEEDRRARLLSNLGYICRRRGQLEAAQQYYEESCAIYKRLGYRRSYAEALSSLGNVFRFQGKTEEALRRCKIAWRIRQELFREGSVGAVTVGVSLSSIGSIYLDAEDIVNAEQCYRDAFDIYNQAGYKRGLANIYNRLGRIEMARGKLEQSKDFFKKAQNISFDVELEYYLNSLNLQGRLLAIQKQWPEAAQFFEQAISMARQIHDEYQLTKNLIALAEACEYQEQQEHARQAWHEAEEIAAREDNNYLYLLGMAEKAKGEIYYSKIDYPTAFHHFARYCHYMTRHNTLEYTAAVRKVMDALYGVSKSEVPALADILTQYWADQQLDQKYPELVNACEEVKELILF